MVLIIMLDKVAITCESVDKSPSVDKSSIGRYFLCGAAPSACVILSNESY